MTWDRTAPYKPESAKILWEVAPWLRGRGLDIGAGDFKVLPHAISVDNMHHAQFGFTKKPDVAVDTAEKLDVFGSQSMDFVYSSHLLEHIDNYSGALKEWWRIVKQGGYLVLYLPDEDEYPKVGEDGANSDHKWNVSYGGIIAAMDDLRGWDLVDFQKRNADDEYSLLFVFKKTGSRTNTQSWIDYMRPDKTACVVRYGAFGDLMQSASVWAGLKKQGYHVTVFSAMPGAAVVEHDPNIDKLVIFDKDQVPNANLGEFWAYQRKKFDKFVNLSESVEGTFLAMSGRVQHMWPPAVRHSIMNRNYVEFAHTLAEVPHATEIKFYATAEEKAWAAKTRLKMGGGPVVMWSLAGSSVHKTWPYLDSIIASIMVQFTESHVVLVGGPECAILEAGWENEPRVHATCGNWSIRQSLAFLDKVDVLLGPETGVMNAAACMPMAKFCFLSHSTHENLTRDWVNVYPLASENTVCPGRGDNQAPACHQLHFNWDHCKKDEQSSTAQCQADITAESVWAKIEPVLHVCNQFREAA